MQSVVEIAKTKENNAARLMGQKQVFLSEQRKRLDELVSYREEYARKFQSQGHLGFDARRLHEYRTFLEKLNLAIVQQRDRINLAAGECHVCQKSWLDSRVNSKALGKVVDRFRMDETRKKDLQEQKELDERAIQLGLAKDRE
jgi:flagellar FliJ protein